jgi:hypothetical protein
MTRIPRRLFEKAGDTRNAHQMLLSCIPPEPESTYSRVDADAVLYCISKHILHKGTHRKRLLVALTVHIPSPFVVID